MWWWKNPSGKTCFFLGSKEDPQAVGLLSFPAKSRLGLRFAKTPPAKLTDAATQAWLANSDHPKTLLQPFFFSMIFVYDSHPTCFPFQKNAGPRLSQMTCLGAEICHHEAHQWEDVQRHIDGQLKQDVQTAAASAPTEKQQKRCLSLRPAIYKTEKIEILWNTTGFVWIWKCFFGGGIWLPFG